MMHPELATRCARHLEAEEGALNALLPRLRALRDALRARGVEALGEAMAGQQELTRRIDEMRVQRLQLRTELATRLRIAPSEATLTRTLRTLPEASAAPLQALADRVRRLAEEVVALHHWLAVHLRVHLSAYERLLADLTGTTASGRYGPAGTLEATDYRPVLQVHG